MDEIDALMKRYVGDVPGASLLVARGGKRNIWRSYGLSNLEDHITATPGTNYRLASVTKQFTAAAVLLLAEDGKLSLDEYLNSLRSSIVSETQLAIALNRANRKLDALRVMNRIKIMKKELETAEENKEELEQC